MSRLIKMALSTRLVNKGTGAGGANTNRSGLSFEKATNNYTRLLNIGFEKTIMNSSKNGYYLSKQFDDKKINFFNKGGLKTYALQEFNVTLNREPDEAYILEYEKHSVLKVLEKKNQNVEGSVDTKLYAGRCIRREYEKVFKNNVEVEYAFCLSDFFKERFASDNKKYQIMKEIIEEDEIIIMYGKDDDYFETLDKWIGMPCEKITPLTPH